MAGQRSRLLTTALLLAVLAAGGCSAAEPVGETLEVSETATSAARALRAARAGLADRMALGQLHVGAGSWAGAQGLIVRASGERLARGPAPGQAAFGQLAWLDAYGEGIRAAMPADAKIDTPLVAAVMREERRDRADAVSASSNAGPAAVSEWLTAEPLPNDEWIEAILYAATRTYVEQVLRSLHAYRVLHP